MKQSSSHIVYAPRPNATPEGEITALANVYAFVRRCAEAKKKGGPEAAPDAGTKFKEDSADAPIIPR